MSSARNRCLSIVVGFGILLSHPADAFHVEDVATADGARGWVVSQQESALVAVEIAFEGGTMADPPGQEGVGELLAALLSEGAGNMDALAFKDRTSHLRARLSSTVDRSALYVRLLTASEQLQSAIHLVALMLHSPRLDARTLERMQPSLARNLQEEARSPEQVATREWYRTVFPEHPIARWPTRETVEKLSRQDLIVHRARLIAKSNLRAVFVGRIDRQEATWALDRIAQGLPGDTDVGSAGKAEPKASEKRVFREVDKSVAAAVFGAPALEIDHRDYAALHVANHVLGSGDFDSRLMRELRSRHGMTYSVRMDLVGDKYVSMAIGEVIAPEENLRGVLNSIREVLAEFAHDGPNQEELDRAKGHLQGSFFANFDGGAKAARTLMGLLLRGKSPGYLQERSQQLEAVSLQDARRVAAEIYEPSRLVISVAGKTRPDR